MGGRFPYRHHFRSDAKFLGSRFRILQQGSSGVNDGITDSFDFALEQALVKFRIPVGNGLDIYAGKFVTFLGYEVIECPANPNFSRGLLFTNAIPLTHTGVYADYKFNDTVEAKFGVVDGWNNSQSTNSADSSLVGNHTSNGAQYAFGGKAITGQVNVTAPGKNANICTSFIYSPDSTEPAGVNGGGDNGPSAVFDIWGNWNPTFVKDSALTLGFNIDLGYSGASGAPNSLAERGGQPDGDFDESNDSTTWWGIALYASYKLNKVVTVSGRLEYLHEDAAINAKFGNGYTPVAGTDLVDFPASQDAYSATLTVAFNIWDNLLTRVEYRADVLQGTTVNQASNNFDVGQNGYVPNHQTIENEVSLEAVYSF